MDEMLMTEMKIMITSNQIASERYYALSQWEINVNASARMQQESEGVSEVSVCMRVESPSDEGVYTTLRVRV